MTLAAEKQLEHIGETKGCANHDYDLTQLTLGVDRDSEQLQDLFDERDEAVRTAIRTVIERAHQQDCKVGICGQAPSDYPEFADFLVECGIDSMSLNPDSVVPVIQHLTT